MEMNHASIGTDSSSYHHTTGLYSSTRPLFSRNSREHEVRDPRPASISSTPCQRRQNRFEKLSVSRNGLACLNPISAIPAATPNFGASILPKRINSANEFRKVSQTAGAAQHGIRYC